MTGYFFQSFEGKVEVIWHLPKRSHEGGSIKQRLKDRHWNNQHFIHKTRV